MKVSESSNSSNSGAYLSGTTSVSRARVPMPRFRRHWGVSARTRYLLGWCDANVSTLREAPVPPEVRRRLLDEAVTRATAASGALAGSTLSVQQVAEVLAGRRQPRSRRRMATAVRNDAAALGALTSGEQQGLELSPGLLRELHGTVGRDLGRRFGGVGRRFRGVPGEFRSDHEPTDGEPTDQAGEGLPCPAASQVPRLVEELCEWLAREFPPAPVRTVVASPSPLALCRGGVSTAVSGAVATVAGASGASAPSGAVASSGAGSAEESGQPFVDGFVHAVASHVYVAWIRPFADGNGRTARLAESCGLLRAGVPGLACHLLPEHYAGTPREYERQLRRAVEDRSLTSFIAYAAEGFADGLAALVHALRQSQLEAAWRSFVFRRFEQMEHRKKSVFRRRRALMLAVPLRSPFRPDDLPLLDPDLAREYGRFSDRTLLRDLRILVRMGLLTEDGDAFRAKSEALLGRSGGAA